MELLNYADGVNGHYCIGRLIDPKSIYWEFYNAGKWCSAGELFTDISVAKGKLRTLEKTHWVKDE